MATMSRLLEAKVLSFLMLSLCGCTVVEVHHADGSVEIYREFAVVDLNLPGKSDGHGAQLVRTQVYGAGVTGDGFVLGYSRQDRAYLDEECRLVIFVTDPSQMKAARQLVERYPEVCLATTE